MKKLKIIIALLSVIFTMNGFSQSVAVASINTYKVYASPTTASMLVRLELIKLDKYSVLDQFDMAEIDNPNLYDDCYAKNCLLAFGEELDVDYVISGSIDKISQKIIITLKLINVNTKEVVKTSTHEFDDQESELQRMVGIVVKKLHGIEPNPELLKRLSFNNEVITSTNVGRINNSGPRMGLVYGVGTIGEFLERPESRGGLEMVPITSNIGFQFEVQYVGTESFSALFEFIPALIGLDQGQFIPQIAVLNGFRFGQAGWEFAFGPSFGLTRTSNGFFDTDTIYNPDTELYWSESDLTTEGFTQASVEENGYFLEKNYDARGDVKFSTRWIMAFGRSFKSGALNIPVNVYYSSVKGGGMVGLSVGFNITRSKK
jgi:hypothetical protein